MLNQRFVVLKEISLGSLTVLPEGTQRTRFHSSNGTSPGLERPGKVNPTHRVSRMAPMPAADNAGCEIRLGLRSPHDLIFAVVNQRTSEQHPFGTPLRRGSLIPIAKLMQGERT